jgi:hypothetical protein
MGFRECMQDLPRSSHDTNESSRYVDVCVPNLQAVICIYSLYAAWYVHSMPSIISPNH